MGRGPPWGFSKISKVGVTGKVLREPPPPIRAVTGNFVARAIRNAICDSIDSRKSYSIANFGRFSPHSCGRFSQCSPNFKQFQSVLVNFSVEDFVDFDQILVEEKELGP